jgi:hypothetical protein
VRDGQAVFARPRHGVQRAQHALGRQPAPAAALGHGGEGRDARLDEQPGGAWALLPKRHRGPFALGYLRHVAADGERDRGALRRRHGGQIGARVTQRAGLGLHRVLRPHGIVPDRVGEERHEQREDRPDQRGDDAAQDGRVRRPNRPRDAVGE